MDIAALVIEVFGIASLTVAFAKYTLDRRAMHADNHMRNNNLTYA